MISIFWFPSIHKECLSLSVCVRCSNNCKNAANLRLHTDQEIDCRIAQYCIAFSTSRFVISIWQICHSRTFDMFKREFTNLFFHTSSQKIKVIMIGLVDQLFCPPPRPFLGKGPIVHLTSSRFYLALIFFQFT